LSVRRPAPQRAARAELTATAYNRQQRYGEPSLDVATLREAGIFVSEPDDYVRLARLKS